MNIKAAAKQTGLSAYTLRYYEEIGLLINIARNSSGHRQYSECDITWIEFIKRLKATQMSLDTIREFARLRIEGDATIPQRMDILCAHRDCVVQQIEELRAHLQRIDEKLALCQRGGPLS